MADTTLNDVLGLDFSEYTTTPYNIKNEPAEKKQVMSMSDVLRGTTIGKEWKTPSIDTLTTMRDRVPTVAEDAIWSLGTNTIRAIKNIVPAGAIAAMTTPVATVAGLSAGAAGWAGGSALGASAVSSLGIAGWWGKALGGLASVAGGVAGGLGLAAGAGALVAGVSPTETATEEYDSPLSPAYQNRMLRELDDKHTKGEITDEEYQKTKDEYLGFIKESKRILEESAINKDEKNMVVDMLDGREYPEGSVVDSVIAWGAKALKDDQDFYDYAVEQRQMNPQGFANVFGGIVGNLVPYYASAYLYRAALTTPKLKTVFQGNRFRENIVEIPTNLSREQVTEKVGALAKAYTTAQMGAEYTAENVLKYIERTGDVNLENYEPSSVEGAMAGAYGRIGAITEFELGGIEPLIIGSFKKVGLKLPTAKVIVKTGGQEAYEETVQNLTQFLAGKVDDTETRTWREFLSDTLQAAGWAAFTGGTIGAMTHRINRANLVKGIVKYGNGAITQEQATQVADTMIEMVEETMDYRKNERLEKLKSYVSAMYEDVDMPEAEKADAINTIASLEYALISQWNTINGTNIADDPLFKGEVNALGWFRTGIPATQKEAIDAYFAELAENEKKLKNLEDWLKKAQEANNQELVKELGQQLDEIESKLEVLRSDKYRLDLLGDLVAEDKRAIALELRKRKQELKAKQKNKDQNIVKELDAAIADQKAGVGGVVTLEETAPVEQVKDFSLPFFDGEITTYYKNGNIKPKVLEKIYSLFTEEELNNIPKYYSKTLREIISNSFGKEHMNLALKSSASVEMIKDAAKRAEITPFQMYNAIRISRGLEPVADTQTPGIEFQPEVYDGLITAKSVQSVVNVLRNLPTGKEYRILYDSTNNLWFVADADKMTHIDIFVKAFEQGNYPQFDTKAQAEQAFQENYLADEQTLLSFLVKKYDTEADAKQGMEHILGTDEYNNAFLRDNMVIFAKYDTDLQDSGFPTASFDHYKVEYKDDKREVVLAEPLTTTDVLYQPGYASMRGELVGDALDADRFEGTGEGSSVWAWGNYLLKSQKIDKAHYFDQFNYTGKPIKYEGKELAEMFNTSFVANAVKEMLEEGKTKEQIIQKIETGIGNLESKIKYITDATLKSIPNNISNAEEIIKDMLKLVESKGIFFVGYEKDSPEFAIQQKYQGTDGYRFNEDARTIITMLIDKAYGETALKSYLTLLNEAEKDLAIFKNLDIKKFTGGKWFRYKGQNLETFITDLMDKFITTSRYYGGKEINNDLQKIFRDAIIKGKSFQQELKNYVDNKVKDFEEKIEEEKQDIIKRNNFNEVELKVLDDIFAKKKLGDSSAKDVESILAVDKIGKGKYGHQYNTPEAQAYRVIHNKYDTLFKALETSAQRVKALKALYEEFKNADIKDFDLKTKASMYEFDVPENKYLLDFTKSLERQSKHVKQALAKLYEETKLGDEPYDYTIKAINPALPRIYKPDEILKNPKSYDDRVATYDGIIDNFLMAWKYHGLETAKKELDSLIVRQTHYAQEAKDNIKRLEKEKKTLAETDSRMYYVNRDIEYNTNSANQHADYRDIAKFVKKKTDKISADANIDDYADITYEFKYKETGLALYNSIKRSFSLTHNEEDIKLAKELNALNKEGKIRPQKAASKLLEKYGIKGVKYEGERDRTGFVTFGRTPMVERLFQNRVSGAAPATYRGAYIPALRFILKANRMDASSLSHELAHDWFEVYVSHAQSGKASKEFMRSWGVLEKALGIDLTKPGSLSKASEIFARAYEAWIMDKKDWAKNIAIADKDKEELDKLFKNYQNHLRDIYNTIANPYFQITWGKVGELKPELRDWFDRMTEIKSLEGMVERGEITQEQANQERINQAIDTVIENTDDPEAKRALENAKVLNDTNRYEAEGGNKNALQRRIATLAKAIDENNMLIKETYDTHRDMLEVAKAADNFVRTRLDDALAIINGQMAEQEGLFKEDIYTALERLALENGDLNLLDELKNSEIANRLAKELGQRVAGFRNWTAGDLDVVSTVKMLDNKFNKALKNKKAQNLLKEATELFESAQKEQDKLADKQLESTLKELECK